MRRFNSWINFWRALSTWRLPTGSLKPALAIAAKYHRAVYDAVFVALCQDLGLPGVTADEPLYNTVHGDFPQIILLRNWS
jgi:predicted nucleic acid-binding protein